MAITDNESNKYGRLNLYTIKLHFFLFMAILFYLLPGWKVLGQSLTDVWDGFIVNDYSLSAGRNSVNAAGIRQRYKWGQYAPDVSISAYSDNVEFATGNASLSFALPGSMSVNSSLSHTVSLFPAESEGGVVQRISVSVSVNQSLQPYWLQGTRRDPNLYLLENAYEMETQNQAYLVKSLMIQLTSQIMQLRQYQRSILLLSESIEVQEELLEANRELSRQGSVSNEYLWDLEQSYWDDMVELYSARENFVELQLSLMNSTGLRLTEPGSLVLPDQGLSLKYRNELVGDEAPEIDRLFTVQANNHYDTVLRKQRQAPSLGVGLTSSWQTLETASLEFPESLFSGGSSNDWRMTLTLDLTSVFFGNRSRDNALDGERNRLLEEEIRNIRRQRKNQIEILKLNIDRLAVQLEHADLSYKNGQALLEDTESLYENGAVSSLEYKQAQLEMHRRKNLLDQISDQLWYQRFLLSWY